MKLGCRSSLWAFAGLILILALVLVVRGRLAPMPLERDEGEYAYAGQLMLDGIPPYAAAYNMKFPGVYAGYALILKIFGQSATAVHAGILVVNAVNIILLFVLMRRLWDHWAAVAAALVFALMTMDMYSLGLAGHATHFVVLFELLGVLVLIRASDSVSAPARWSWRYFLAGMLLGFCIVMSQQGAPFVVFAAAWIAIQRRQIWRRELALFGGAFLPIFIMGLWLAHAGVFGKFWFWTIDYARSYASQHTMSEAPTLFLRGLSFLIQDSFGLWALAAAGLIFGWTVKERRHAMSFILLLFGFSFLAASAGFYYRPHYFILVMPAAAMLAAAALSAMAVQLNRLNHFFGGPAAMILCGLACVTLLLRQRHFLFEMSPEMACREIYTQDPFAESVAVGAYLASHADPTDTVAVFGSEPQIYFYSHRRSATGYIYTYSLMEDQPRALQMQYEMAGEIRAAHPGYIVLVNDPSSWARKDHSQWWIFYWFDEYKSHYEVVKTFDIWADRQLHYDRREISKLPFVPSTVEILRRKDG